MKLTRSVPTDGNLYPSVFNVLHALPETMLHQHEHDALRHPLATYNLSMSRVLDAFRAVLDEQTKLGDSTANAEGVLQFDQEPLLAAQKELLDSLASHLDDGYQILKALYPAVRLKREERFADKWLEAAGHSGVMHVYRDAIATYRQSFISIVNHIKHATGRLRLCVMDDGRQKIGGYYLETPDREGVVGPDRLIHPGNTAFSFNRDLRYHFCHLYEVGDALARALQRAAKKDYTLTLNGDPVPATNAQLEEVAERISNLAFWFFPDEVSKLAPITHFLRAAEGAALSVEDTRAVVPFAPRSATVLTTTKGDGVTRAWRLPYMSWTDTPRT